MENERSTRTPESAASTRPPAEIRGDIHSEIPVGSGKKLVLAVLDERRGRYHDLGIYEETMDGRARRLVAITRSRTTRKLAIALLLAGEEADDRTADELRAMPRETQAEAPDTAPSARPGARESLRSSAAGHHGAEIRRPGRPPTSWTAATDGNTAPRALEADKEGS